MSEIRRPPKLRRPAPAPIRCSPAIERLRRAADDSRDERARRSLAHAFWQSTAARTPLLESGEDGEQVITFLWRSEDASAVLLFVNRLTDETDLARSELERVPGTDIWHLSYALEPDWRGSYGFVVHDGDGPAPWRCIDDQVSLRGLLDRARFDPRNPLTCPNRTGTALSVAEQPAAPPQPWRDAARRSACDASSLSSGVGPDGHECWLYEPRIPPGADAPLWLLLDGEVWVERFDFDRALDAMIEQGALPPMRVVFVGSGGVERRWESLGGDSGFTDALADRYLPWAREQFGVEAPAGRCGIAGQSLGGLVALRAGVARPDAFDLVLAQSASLWLEAPELDRLTGAAEPRPRFRIEVGTHEWVLLEPNRAFHAGLAGTGVDAALVEYAGGHDYACWRGGLADGLVALSR